MAKSNSTKYNWDALVRQDTLAIVGACLVIAGIAGGIAAVAEGVFSAAGAIVGVLALGATGYVLRTAVVSPSPENFALLEAKAYAWANSAETPDDRKSRLSAISQFGAMGAFANAGVDPDALANPAINVDGTPMLPGGMVDVNGNPFGVSALPEFQVHGMDGANFDHFNSGASSPIGMDHSNGMSSFH